MNIVAQATPVGSGAIALIRLSGKNIRNLINDICILSSKKKIIEVFTHTINHGYIINKNNEILDSVLFLIMDSPRSFTGEDIIEITCHNNELIISSIIKEICNLGARIANRGEFTQRAVENKKIDILQAEAINELICANNELAIRASLSQLEGSLSSKINEIDNDLSVIAAWCQANFEFLEEEREFTSQILKKILNLEIKIDEIIENNNASVIVKNGIRIAIIGTVNAGKSSIFNALVKKNRAIVTNIAGTTRDCIEYNIYRNNLNYTLIDTAGIRHTKSIIEKEGIKKSIQEMKGADFVLIVYDLTQDLSENIINFYKEIFLENKEKSLIIINKNDLLNKNEIENKIKEDLFLSLFYEELKNKNKIEFLSAKNNNNLDSIWNFVDNELKNEKNLRTLPYIINNRHINILFTAKNKIENIKNKLMNNKNIYYEIILNDVHETQECITSFSGRDINEKSMQKVFEEFCVGK